MICGACAGHTEQIMSSSNETASRDEREPSIELSDEHGASSQASRRTFLSLGAFGALSSVVGACAVDPPEHGDDDGGGTTGGGTGPAGGKGGSSAAGMNSSGGTGAAGKAGSGGTQATGGAGNGTGGSTGGSTGGTAPAGGAGSGGTGNPQAGNGGTGNPQAGGAGESGSGVTGGAPAGGTGGTGGTGSGGSPSVGGGKENNGAECPIGTVPTFADAVNNEALPDPFKFLDGSRISRKEDWECLRAELSAIVQACIYGPKMPPPDTLDATFSGGKLTVNMKVGSNTASFNVSITGGGSEGSPAPCLIGCGGSSLGSISGLASITLPNNNFASEMGLGGIVKDLFGNTAQKSGALIGWAWGLSRIIDGLELCPEAGIDTKRIAVTGCSRNGKGALAMGAFDERVALTIPQEGGSGGPALWRVADAEYKLGQKIQEAGEIIGEADWTGADFKQYANNRANVNKLPGDQHMTIALCAPRAVLVIDNDIDWLGPVACYGGGAAAAMVYQALGIADRCGVSVSTSHNHCSFPSSQSAHLNAFVNRFLKKMDADTSGVDDHNSSSSTSKLRDFDKTRWCPWDIPTLSGNLAWDSFAGDCREQPDAASATTLRAPAAFPRGTLPAAAPRSIRHRRRTPARSRRAADCSAWFRIRRLSGRSPYRAGNPCGT